MATTPATPAGEYGIDLTLDGYTIESFSEKDAPVRETVPDQHNAVAKELRYDTRHELSLTVRGSSKPDDTTITFNSHTYIVDTVEDAGTYNGLRRYNVTGHYFTNCSAETRVGGEVGGN